MTKLKNFKSMLFFFLLIGCGFTPILKNLDLSTLKIKEIEYTGDKQLIFKLQQSLFALENNKDPNGLTLAIRISKNLIPTNKNTSGVTTEEEIYLNVNLKINDAQKNILTETIEERRRINVSNNLISDQEKRETETNTLINNISQKIKIQIFFALKQ